jgi:sugar diacid utilization regulator
MARTRKPVSARDESVNMLAGIAERAGRQAHGVPVELLDGYLADLDAVSATGRPPGPDRVRARHDAGAQAAAQGVPLGGVVDLHLSATWMAWPVLTGVRRATDADAVRAVGEVILRATDAAVMAVTEGYEQAQRWLVRQEESFRREFVDDLLEGRGMGQLVERAERFGLRLAGSTVVAAMSCPQSLVDGGEVARSVESALHLRGDSRDVLITTKTGLLVCVCPDTMAGALDEFVRQVSSTLGADSAWLVGIGRAQSGPGGAVRSFEQARQALDIAERLELPGRVHKADDLLVYQVLLRDSAALADLVSVVLEPLRGARGGPGALLETLATYFACGQVATACARELHVGVRTVTYRLHRIGELTGYSVENPSQALSLQIAVLGAKLLHWPATTTP